MTRSSLVACTMAAVLLVQDCSLIGLGIGSASPKYERVETPYESLAEGSEVRVVRVVREDRARETSPVDGVYRGAHAGYLFVDTEWGGRALDERQVVEVDRRTGSHWAEGLVAGIALDVVIGSFLAYQIANSRSSQLSIGPWN